MVDQPVVINAGCGATGAERTPQLFHSWRHIRIDVDTSVQPDIVADITDMSAVPGGTADALWASHCVEHLYAHEVKTALSEFRRVLKDDGFAIITVPDLQVIARYVADDKMGEVLYQSPAGPITPHDILFGLGAAVAAGQVHMAHRSGFTPSTLVAKLQEAGFRDFIVRRRENLELVAVARKTPWAAPEYGQALMDALRL
jgi:SAM-dependent methyltransferase